MTTVAVLTDPPVEGAAATRLADGDLLTDVEAAELYAAMLADVCAAVASSGAELLVNYRPADQCPDDVDDPEAAVRSVVADAVGEDADVRYEVQVGSSFDARVGNTITHLLEREGVKTAAAVTPRAALLGRKHVDSAAMKLRGSEVVVGPSTDGRWYYAGFAEPVDFDGAFATPAVETLVDRAGDAGLGVDFLPMLPVLERPGDLATVLPQVRAKRAAGRRVPERTAERLVGLGLSVVDEGGEPTIRRA